MYKQLSEELSRLQQQLQDLQDSPHRVNVTHHVRTTTDPPEDKVNGEKVRYERGKGGGGNSIKIFHSLSGLFIEMRGPCL